MDIKTLPLKVEYVGRTVRENDWQCFEWRCTLSSKNAAWTFPYYCGLAHIETRPGAPKDKGNPRTIFREDWERRWTKPKAPSAEDVFASLLLDASAADENFHDWCTNSDYSDDSIKALNVYKACLETATQLRKHLGRETVEALRELLKDH